MAMFRYSDYATQVSDLLGLCQCVLDEQAYFELLDHWQSLNASHGSGTWINLLKGMDWFEEFLDRVRFSMVQAGLEPNHLLREYGIFK